jgi:hypothetical protein
VLENTCLRRVFFELVILTLQFPFTSKKSNQYCDMLVEYRNDRTVTPKELGKWRFCCNGYLQ